jgi:hypothetical protein
MGYADAALAVLVDGKNRRGGRREVRRSPPTNEVSQMG